MENTNGENKTLINFTPTNTPNKQINFITRSGLKATTNGKINPMTGGIKRRPSPDLEMTNKFDALAEETPSKKSRPARKSLDFQDDPIHDHDPEDEPFTLVENRKSKKPNPTGNHPQHNYEGPLYIIFTLLANIIFKDQYAKTLLKAFNNQVGRCPHNLGKKELILTIDKGMITKAKNFKFDHLGLPEIKMTIQNKKHQKENNTSNKGPSKLTENSKGIINVPIDLNEKDFEKTYKFKENKINSMVKIINKFGKFTGKVIVNFGTSIAPLHILGEIYMTTVHPILFTIKRCNCCQKFGHSAKNCRANFIACAYCAYPHPYAQCPYFRNPWYKQCANCQGPHPAYDKYCPVFLKYKNEIERKNQKIKQEWNNRINTNNKETRPIPTEKDRKITTQTNLKPVPPPNGEKKSTLVPKGLIQTLFKIILDPENLKNITMMSPKQRNNLIDEITNYPEKFERNHPLTTPAPTNTPQTTPMETTTSSPRGANKPATPAPTNEDLLNRNRSENLLDIHIQSIIKESETIATSPLPALPTTLAPPTAPTTPTKQDSPPSPPKINPTITSEIVTPANAPHTSAPPPQPSPSAQSESKNEAETTQPAPPTASPTYADAITNKTTPTQTQEKSNRKSVNMLGPAIHPHMPQMVTRNINLSQAQGSRTKKLLNKKLNYTGTDMQQKLIQRQPKTAYRRAETKSKN